MQSTNEILSFYGWWQFSVCFFAFLALFAIWRHIGKKQQDFGQVWLALSVLCWSFSGLAEVYFNDVHQSNRLLLEGWRSILSLFNSLFILLALPWFRFLPGPLAPIINSKHWKFIVGLPFVFSLLPTINKMIFGRTIAIMSELDVYYSLLTLAFLAFVLWESFAKRRLKLLAWLSMATILIALIAQFYKLTDASINLNLFSAIFKTCLIMIFFALALSWVKELSENVLPPANYFKLNFADPNKKSKQKHTILITGLSGKDHQYIKLTPNAYNLLYKFALQRKSKIDDWLEIKPKSFTESTKIYDIQDYNEVKRLIIMILDGLFGKGNWTLELHLHPLKNLLFELSEKRERKIRLALPPENIIL
ncbi:hypothetical protein [Maribacter sp. 2210JD10-5]|uniref:hypothetical protein n=1 Tax=Maribacter sp. 2210JD10-5 TaxID=3386272 RepID=UPI0039BCE500